MAFLYDNPIGDVGWVRQHEMGRLAIEKALGDKVKTKYVQVPTGADSERVMRSLAQSGTKLIYGVSFGYMNPMAKVAAQFPGTTFMNAQGFMTSKNMGVYSARVYEGFYMNGVIAGKMSKTGTVGYIASMPVPEVVQGVNAFMLGMRSVNPKATVKIVWLNTWYDPGREREAANALLSDGADVLTSVLSSPVAVQVAEERGAYAVAWQSDMSKYGPRAQLSCALLDWSNPYTQITKAVAAGTWKSSNDWLGVREGVIRMVGLSASLPSDVRQLVTHIESDMKSGSFKPFTGPIVDQDGKQRVAAGVSMSDDELRKIDWLVAGIQGRIPAN
ncbi:BMP family ABC transporter substrate-binding protein [Variovorax sp. Sphag1AA]|uniref:BMP family ABC transporter substrate-binding protein n=1 Tax=Variovorax sp. Sphag1AA TaxID=2587027 RepID=UPI00180D4C13|nr:BMP family ABC transporter substrate-binding protein [Variovorax sp. Sphag1AA]MBB3182027.1 simple sugar transport system substrate-binding protein [Variovorax sp. Sphag1AA]